jgi:apolipoprotein N-acyltransferase
VLLTAAVTYGYIRRAQAEFREGPRVALVQANFPTTVKQDPRKAAEVFTRHYFLTGQSVKLQPDVIVWPETMYRAPLMMADSTLTDAELERLAPGIPAEAWRATQVPKALANMSQQAGAATIIGIESAVATKDGFRHYNSAVFSQPWTGIGGRYDKMHRVVFGEYIPLKNELPWLHALTPFSNNFGIDAGAGPVIFEYDKWRFAPIICFEDTVPQLVRGIVAANPGGSKTGKGVDCLVNLTNDGWFHGSSELDQHLITALFRCVETRTPMVRAVNTGISAVIDGDGVVVEPDAVLDGRTLLEEDEQFQMRRRAEAEAAAKTSIEPAAADSAEDKTETAEGRQPPQEPSAIDKARISMRDPRTGRWRKQLDAVLVDDVPLDNRNSLYVVWGDWFGASCLFLCLCVFLGNFVPSTRETASRAD